MDQIERAAKISVGRAVGFATLAIATAVLGLIFDPTLAFKTGGALTLLMAAVLWLKAELAPSQPYRSTEVWLLLDQRLGLPDEYAQRVVSTVLRSVYRRFARASAGAAFGLWLLGLSFQVLG